MASSREETNFSRLLHRCEAMASDKKYDDWRLEKYVATLQEYLHKLRNLSTNKPPQEILAEYTRKVDFLKGLIETEKLHSCSERALAADLLTPGLKSTDPGTASNEIHLQVKARYQREVRDELLGSTKAEPENGVIRQRKAGVGETSAWASGSSVSVEEDVDTVIKHQQQLQEKLADEMVYLAQNMKEHATAAGRIVRDDTKKLVDSNKLADINYGKLKVESERLEKHVQKSCNWWIWLMLGAVCFTFVWMVLFMRMFPKR